MEPQELRGCVRGAGLLSVDAWQTSPDLRLQNLERRSARMIFECKDLGLGFMLPVHSPRTGVVADQNTYR